MSKKYLGFGVVLLAIGIVLFYYSAIKNPLLAPVQLPPATTTRETTMMTSTVSPKNATYTIEGVPVTLSNGMAETPAAPGSTGSIETDYFGNEVSADLNHDGVMDTAFLLTQSTGGTGVFYYLVAALKFLDGYHGSEGVRIGDRILPQSTTLENGVIVVNYADRAADEPFSITPSIGKTVRFIFDARAMKFSAVPQSRTATTTPALELTDKKWQWVRTNYTDGRVFVPKNSTAFSLTFGNGTVSGTTDCNSLSGPYTTSGTNSLMFGRMMMTRMYCDGSEEGVFADLLGQIATYSFTQKGELYLGLKANSGTMILQ